MGEKWAARPRGRYGIDAPPVVFGELLAVLVCGAAIAVCHLHGITTGVIVAAVVGGIALVMLISHLFTSVLGKFLVWRKLLDHLHLRGDETVLDLGCGRGAVLVATAQRLPRGRAVGVDVWRSRDQLGNAEAATRKNAVAAKVADRIELHTANVTALPFPAETFDVVVSSLVFHNIGSRAGIAAAIDEALRVLRRGGRLLIADLGTLDGYEQQLAEWGATDIDVRNLGWRMWWCGPWLATNLVTATKAR